MISTEFLKVLTIVYETDDLDEIIGDSNARSFKRHVLIPYSNIFFLQEGIDKRETEIILIDGETIIALEKLATIEEKWHKWYELNHSLHFYTKSN
jgi:hypothetical protein